MAILEKDLHKQRALPPPFDEIVENDAKRSEMHQSGVIPFDEYVKLMQVRRLLTKAAQDALNHHPKNAPRTA